MLPLEAVCATHERSTASCVLALLNLALSAATWAYGRRLVNPEVFGDGVHAQEPKDKQHHRERADERERSQAKAPDSIEHELPRAMWKPPGP